MPRARASRHRERSPASRRPLTAASRDSSRKSIRDVDSREPNGSTSATRLTGRPQPRRGGGRPHHRRRGRRSSPSTRQRTVRQTLMARRTRLSATSAHLRSSAVRSLKASPSGVTSCWSTSRSVASVMASMSPGVITSTCGGRANGKRFQKRSLECRPDLGQARAAAAQVDTGGQHLGSGQPRAPTHPGCPDVSVRRRRIAFTRRARRPADLVRSRP